MVLNFNTDIDVPSISNRSNAYETTRNNKHVVRRNIIPQIITINFCKPVFYIELIMIALDSEIIFH